MSTRIPPSLKWLTTKRARLVGDIEKAEKQLKEIIKLKEKQVQVLRSDLAALDKAIRMHDIQINPDLIKPIRGQSAGRFFAYGELTRTILNCLKHFHPQILTSTEIAIYAANKIQIDPTSIEFLAIRKSVALRLRGLCATKHVARLHEAQTCQEGRWKLGENTIFKREEVID